MYLHINVEQIGAYRSLGYIYIVFANKNKLENIRYRFLERSVFVKITL